MNLPLLEALVHIFPELYQLVMDQLDAVSKIKIKLNKPRSESDQVSDGGKDILGFHDTKQFDYNPYTYRRIVN